MKTICASLLLASALVAFDAGHAIADDIAAGWGGNSLGQLGNNSTTQSNVPVDVNRSGVLAGKTVVQISAGDDHSCAVTSDGGAYCWGRNSNGRLGNNSTTSSRVPVAVDTSGALNGKTVIQISANTDNTCAVTADGGAYCWGSNNNGQLGDNSTTQSLVPVAVDTSGVLSGAFLSHISVGWEATSFALSVAGGPGRAIAAGPSATWRQMAPVCTPSGSATVAGVFGSGTAMNLTTADYAVANPAASQGWAVWRHDPLTNQCVRLAATDTLSLGAGYWFRSFQPGCQGRLIMTCPNAAPAAPVTQAEGCASANGCQAIALASVAGVDRQNLVGNPFPYAIDWSQVRVRIDSSSTTYTPSQADCGASCGSGGNAPFAVISNTINVWNGTAYNAYADSGVTAGKLPYFSSFWVKALSAANGHKVELLIPALVTGSGGPFSALARTRTLGTRVASAGLQSATAPAPGSWFVRLKVDDYAKGRKFDNALLGQQPGALAGWDRQDLPAMPPFAAPYLYLTFPRPSWGTKAVDYASDFRPAGVLTAGDWPFELRASAIGSTVYLRREGDAAILKRSVLVDPATGATIRGDDPRWSGNGVPVKIATTTRKFIWRYLGP